MRYKFDMSNKHLKDVQQVTFQHLTHYDHAYTEYELKPAKRYEELQGLVWMHILMKDEDVHDEHLKRMAYYVDTQYNNIIKLRAIETRKTLNYRHSVDVLDNVPEIFHSNLLSGSRCHV